MEYSETTSLELQICSELHATLLQILATSKEGPLNENRGNLGIEDEESSMPLEDAVLENSNQFHRWHSELEAARVLEAEEKYQEYANMLKHHLQSIQELQDKVCIFKYSRKVSTLYTHFHYGSLLFCIQTSGAFMFSNP